MFNNTSKTGWYPNEYKIEIHQRLKSIEKENYVFRKRSPQFNDRSLLIKWLRKVFDELKFCRVSLHLAVFLLDYFMDSYSINSEQLTLISLICLVLAGKFSEREVNVPKITEMNEILEENYSQADVIYFEELILKHFKWNLSMPTALHFLELYLDDAVIPADVCQNCSSFSHVSRVIKSTVQDYADVTLEDSDLIKFAPSHVAASCILAVRKSFSLRPFWPEKLQKLSLYTEDQLSTCVTLIIEFREKYKQLRKRKFDESPDHGYETECSSPSPNHLKTRKV